MASSSNSESTATYDIFLSFRGETRKKFTDHLYKALTEANFKTFRDEEEIPMGGFIKPELEKAIMNSRMSVIVLSQNYAKSTACLFELQLILERGRTQDHFVLPVFYEVDPQEIKEQAEKLDFGKKVVAVEKVTGWREALKEVARMKVMVSQNQCDGYETKFIQEIVGEVNNKLPGKRLRFVDHQASTDSRAKRQKIADDQGSNQILIPPMKEFVEFTKARNTENIWERLMNDKVSKIGVYGMGGIGKTTIMEYIHNRLISLGKFIVYWVTVSKPFSITNIQSDIAKAVKLSFSDDKDVHRRARELYAKLSQNKKYVIIFDDLWEYFDLKHVGIPEPTQGYGCKIVLTTRSWEVCRKMGCASVEVKLLTEEEALTLFLKNVVIDDMVLTPEVNLIAADMAKECACLPLAIVTVGGSMRGLTDIRSWRNALDKLKKLRKDTINFEVKVLEQLKFSYDCLEDGVLKNCFLYCSLYPEDHAIPVKELLELWIAEELIDANNSVQVMEDEGHEILRKLTSRCLLESCIAFREECVRMHDLIRDVALSITRSSPRFMVKAGERLESIPDEDWSVDLEKISFMYSEIEDLPLITPHVCPQLTTVLLNDIGLAEIPDSFFTNMPRVKILDLSKNEIESLPEPIFNLVNLHALILGACTKLRNVPSLENLKALTVFILTRSKVKKLPEGIEELVNLVKLDLSNNIRLEDFPTSKICRLSKLRFLRLDGTNVEVAAEDLKCLKALKVVGVRFPNITELTSYVTSQQCQGLEKYLLIVRDKNLDEMEIDSDISRMDQLNRKEVRIYSEWIGFESESESDSEPLEVDQPVLPANMDYFELYYFNIAIDLSTLLKDARDLRSCVFDDCRKLESIFSYSSFSKDGRIFLGTVEKLELLWLPLCRGLFDRIAPLQNISFNLKSLTIMRCDEMENIFPVQILQNFPNLEQLCVFFCDKVEDIIVKKEEMSNQDHGPHNIDTINFPKLRILGIRHLPRLKSIYNGMMVCEAIQEVRVEDCAKVKRLPLSLQATAPPSPDKKKTAPPSPDKKKAAPPSLKFIMGGVNWWEDLEWDDPDAKGILQPFFKQGLF